VIGCLVENVGGGRKFKAAREFDSSHDFVALLDLKSRVAYLVLG
jgi:hypothetical protein